MNIEQAKKYINEAISVVHELHSNSPSYNNTYHKLLTLALHELETPVVPKSNGYCGKCLWPDAQCKCPSKGYLPEAPWKDKMKIRPEDFTITIDWVDAGKWGVHRENKVLVRHNPTGIWDARQSTRSQHANKQLAWDMVINTIKAQGWTE